MIQQIMKMASSLASLQILAVAAADGSLSLTFVPKIKEGTDPKLATVFTLKGTPEELEKDLSGHLEAIQTKRETLAETADAVKAVIEQATKDAAAKATEKKATKAKASSATPSTSTSKAQSAAEEDDDGDGNGDSDPDDENGLNSPHPASAAAAASTPKAPAAAELNLFG